MSKSLGIITAAEDDFEGFLAMGWVVDNVWAFVKHGPNLEVKSLDYCIISGKPGECGVGWNMAVLISCKLINSITLKHPNISDPTVYASTGKIKGSKNKSITVIWKPDN